MDNKAKTTSETNIIENKTNGLSKKVWDLQRTPPEVHLNKDGTVPAHLPSMLKQGQLRMTDYVNPDSGKKTALTKINNQVLVVELTKLKNGRF